MINTTSHQVAGIATALLTNSEKAADSLSVKGVAEMTEADNPDEVFLLFHIKKEDVCRLGDCFMIVVPGAKEGFGDNNNE